MLQWMGGSRRKVNTSRKSTMNRQKQYFEQRRRQQQHQQQTNGIESYAYGIHAAGKHEKEHQSLDIVNLLNLSRDSVEQKSSCPNGREDIEVDASRVTHGLSEESKTIRPKMVAPIAIEFNKERAESGFHSEVASPKKSVSFAPDNQRHTLGEMYSKPHNSRTPVEQCSESCLLDFLGNDGLEDDYVEESPVHEAHVAFSVEGLGKVGMETPVHSPKQAGRTFSYDCSSPLHAARKISSFKNRKRLDDIEIEMMQDTVMQDVHNPLRSDGLEFSVDVMDSFSDPKKKFSLNGHDSKFETYCGGRSIFDDVENSKKDRWGGRSNFFEENSLDEWDHGISWKQWPNEVNYRSVDNLMHREYHTSDFTFEESFFPTRFASGITDKFNILESPSYSRLQVSENDLDFMISNGARQHTVERNFDFGGVASEPGWSCFATENEKDNMSLLSEESCSSSAVRVNSIRKHSKRIHHNSYVDPEYKYNVVMTSPKRTQDRSRDFCQLDDIAHRSAEYTDVPKSSNFKPAHHSNTPFQVKRTSKSNWWSEERYMSGDKNKGSTSFHSGTNCPLTGSKSFSRKPSSSIDSPEFNADARPSKHCEPDASSPSGSFISKKFALHDSALPSNNARGSARPDFIPCLYGQTPSSDLSAQESFSKAEEGKVECLPKENSRQDEEHSILNNLFTEDEDATSALRSKSKNSECQKSKDADADSRIEDVDDHAEEASSFLKSPDKSQNRADKPEDCQNSRIPLPSRSWNKDMEYSVPQERKKESKQQREFVDSSSQA